MTITLIDVLSCCSYARNAMNEAALQLDGVVAEYQRNGRFAGDYYKTHPDYTRLEAAYSHTIAVYHSWMRVVADVRAGDDPTIAVLKRELKP
jgi:hypothetical protein